jgi:hypothetical protein
VAKITVIISSEKPNRWRYRTYSGVGSVVPTTPTANASALTAKPAPRPSRGKRMCSGALS